MKKTMILLLTLAGIALPVAVGAPALDESTFKRLHDQLQPPQDEAWRELPWQDSLLKAREHAATQKKPIYMLVRSGNPLGCV